MRIYTDGACLGNPGPGGWGWAAVQDVDQVEPEAFGYGGTAGITTTNNRMELLAAIRGLQYAPDLPVGTMVILLSDSKYVIDGINLWIKGWEKNGWRNAKRKPVVNQDLWREFRALQLSLPHVTFDWVRGHNGDKWNEYVDNLANKEAGILV